MSKENPPERTAAPNTRQIYLHTFLHFSIDIRLDEHTKAIPARMYNMYPRRGQHKQAQTMTTKKIVWSVRSVRHCLEGPKLKLKWDHQHRTIKHNLVTDILLSWQLTVDSLSHSLSHLRLCVMLLWVVKSLSCPCCHLLPPTAATSQKHQGHLQVMHTNRNRNRHDITRHSTKVTRDTSSVPR